MSLSGAGDDQIRSVHTRGGQYLVDEQLLGWRSVASVRRRDIGYGSGDLRPQPSAPRFHERGPLKILSAH